MVQSVAASRYRRVSSSCRPFWGPRVFHELEFELLAALVVVSEQAANLRLVPDPVVIPALGDTQLVRHDSGQRSRRRWTATFDRSWIETTGVGAGTDAPFTEVCRMWKGSSASSQSAK